MEPEIVEKGGEQWLTFSTYPGAHGLEIAVKAHPKVEQFIRSIGDGTVMNAAGYDNRWFKVGNNDLDVYNLARSFKNVTYTLDKPSQVLFEGPGESTGVGPEGRVNLSFLRLKGISEGNGIVFGVKDLYPRNFRRELNHKVGQAFRALVQDHIRPIRITLVISSQEF